LDRIDDDQPSFMSADFFIADRYIQNPQHFAVFPRLNNQCVTNDHRFFNAGMRMSADNDVNSFNGPGQGHIGRQAKMGKNDDQIGLISQLADKLLRGINDRRKNQAFNIFRMRCGGCFFRDQSDDPHFQAGDVFDHIRFDGRETADIGGQNRKSCFGNPFFENILSEIEFVISEDHCRKPHDIHRLDGGFAFKKVCPRMPLNKVSGSQKQCRLMFSELID